ncbi:MAG: FHA domain-containing protein [Xanthomonadales bacterium]|jgi:pSer/pThr/pTyr-binding forkhead associated (FHA) protein|nr:FHA domain-containing protein [Xanthomonadales bacterium]
MIKLLFPNGEHAPVDLGDGTHVIGSGADAKVNVPARGVAPRHAEVLVNGESYKIRPIHSDQPIQVNGVRIQNSSAIKPGDLLFFGEVRCRVVAVDKAATTSVSVKGHSDDDDGRTKVRSALPKFVLRGVSGATFGKVFPISGPTVIGRQDGCDIAIATEELSRRHCEVRPTPDGLWVEDLGSANGTFINDKRVTRELIRAGDELRLDTLRFQVLAPGKDGGGHLPVARPTSESSSAAAATAKSGLSAAVWVGIGVGIAILAVVGAKLAGLF